MELLKHIYENGHDHPDRTGTGRRSIFGAEIRFNLKDGFPLVTTRKVPYKAIFREMLWFIKGSTSNLELTENGVHIWDKWAVKEEDVNDFLHHVIPDGVDAEGERETIRPFFSKYLHSIGHMYGEIWRNAPVSNSSENGICPTPLFEDIASDKLELYKKAYEVIEPKTEEGETVSFESFAAFSNMRSVDQLQNLILGLKKDPYSARHVVTAWIPEYISYPGVSPQHNVLMNKGALAPCHAIFQCFVTPNKDGKPLLSLKMFQR